MIFLYEKQIYDKVKEKFWKREFKEKLDEEWVMNEKLKSGLFYILNNKRNTNWKK